MQRNYILHYSIRLGAFKAEIALSTYIILRREINRIPLGHFLRPRVITSRLSSRVHPSIVLHRMLAHRHRARWVSGAFVILLQREYDARISPMLVRAHRNSTWLSVHLGGWEFLPVDVAFPSFSPPTLCFPPRKRDKETRARASDRECILYIRSYLCEREPILSSSRPIMYSPSNAEEESIREQTFSLYALRRRRRAVADTQRCSYVISSHRGL